MTDGTAVGTDRSERARRNVSVDGLRFFRTIAEWRNEGSLAGLELTR
jgi:hypothetical protein